MNLYEFPKNIYEILNRTSRVKISDNTFCIIKCYLSTIYSMYPLCSCIGQKTLIMLYLTNEIPKPFGLIIAHSTLPPNCETVRINNKRRYNKDNGGRWPLQKFPGHSQIMYARGFFKYLSRYLYDIMLFIIHAVLAVYSVMYRAREISNGNQMHLLFGKDISHILSVCFNFCSAH